MLAWKRTGIGWAVLVLWVAAGEAAPLAVPPVAKLKDLHLQTELVRDGRPLAVLVAPVSGVYDAAARRIAEAVKALTGVDLPIERDASRAASLPLKGHTIVLGNRSTNRLIAELYHRYYTLLDLKYPGPGGYEVRTLHNPFGNGANAVFVGGSDGAGVEAAADVLIARLREAAKGRSLCIGRLAEIRLGKGLQPPKTLADAQTWEASAGYGSIGYFGWNSLSKRMALYYMTGEEVHAREFVRLAFPDAAAKREIAQVDGERIEDKDHPLSGPYHYTAHLMILYWDLIEESPGFSDDERLRITRAFAEQVNHWAAEWAYAARTDRPPRRVGSRHDQWAAISLYCLARYFQTYYPDPFWKRHLDAAARHFAPLHEHAWVAGENDNLFWYNTATAPILTYLLLTGDRVPVENGVLGTLLRGQEILASGRSPDWALHSAAIDFLHKAAYLTQDGRWIAYRQRTGLDTDGFRLGQSFWPEEHLAPRPPDDLVNRWTIHRLPKPMWEARQSGIAHDESFLFGSFRSRPDAGGDFVLLDGFNGASRNPYHTFTILELRLGGYTLLRDYLNQVITRVDGLMEPKIAMDAALKRCEVIGATALAIGEVPDAALANWRRTLVQRTGRYAVVVDELTFRQESPNAEVVIEWQTERGGERLADGQVMFQAPREDGVRQNHSGAQLLAAAPLRTTGRGTRWTMQWLGPVRHHERKTFFTLLGIEPGATQPTLACCRTGEHSAALGLPGPAAAIVRGTGDRAAEMAVVAADHVVAIAATQIEGLIESSEPIDLDWDFAKGELHVAASKTSEISVRRAPGAPPRRGARLFEGRALADGRTGFSLRAGRHVLYGMVPAAEPLARLRARLESELQAARASRAQAVATAATTIEPDAAPWRPTATAQLSGPIVDLEVIPQSRGPLIAAAAGKAVYLVGFDGRMRGTLETDGPIRMLRWWPEPGLLLAGCADEKVIAFDPAAALRGDRAGVRRWVFVSEMDPAVERAGKTYWFKSEPGHEGIHGLYTGQFLEGKSQAFVGSACTLEILDDAGKLVRRMPLFWGDVSVFALTDGPKGSRNLLAGWKYNGVNWVAIVNSRTLDPEPRGFLAVPPGHTYIDGWSSMNRHHLFYDDLDGDGAREVTSEINGTWNRVCVWSAEGKPLYAANFGPGPRIPERTMRDIDLGDLDGDGRKEIVAATSHGMVVALNAKCAKRWAVRLPSPASVLACVRPKDANEGRVVLGCDDAAVRVLDAQGRLVRRAALTGRPTRIQTWAEATGPVHVILGTQSGEVAAFHAAE